MDGTIRVRKRSEHSSLKFLNLQKMRSSSRNRFAFCLRVADLVGYSGRLTFCVLLSLSSCAALSLGLTPISRPVASNYCRAATLKCAYNPEPSKARPKKQKIKSPKEKVKAPVSPVNLEAEKTFFLGPPSASEMIIPGLSILTVVGVIPFAASVARQTWTRYKLTNRRIEIASGFQGKEVVQVTILHGMSRKHTC